MNLRWRKILLIVFVLLFCCVCMIACKNEKSKELQEEEDRVSGDSVGVECVHTFSEDWSFDDEYHWHAATCEHYTEVSNKSEHIWNEGQIIKEATEEKSGIKKCTCTICGYQKNISYTIDAHVHTFSSKWSFDEEYHWREINCGHGDLEGVDPFVDLAKHSFDPVTHICVCGCKELVTLTFVDYNGQILATIKKEFGTSVVLADEMQIPEREGYIFSGWTNGVSTTDRLLATESITLRANYNRTYIVLFVSNNSIFDTQYVVEGSNASPPRNNPQKDGFIFEGWENYTDITNDRIVNAIYEPIQYSVTFVMPDGVAIGQSQNISYGSTATVPEVDNYWFNWDNYHMYMFTDWTFNGNHGWDYTNVEAEVISQYKTDASKTPSVTITANYGTEYNLPVIVIEEETSTDTTMKVNISVILPSNISCYLYAVDLQFSFTDIAINKDTINPSTVFYEMATSNYNNKTRTFNFIWTSDGTGKVYSQQQIIDTIEFSKSSSQVKIGDDNFVLVNTSSIIVAASEDADYNDLQKITPIVVYRKK